MTYNDTKKGCVPACQDGNKYVVKPENRCSTTVTAARLFWHHRTTKIDRFRQEACRFCICTSSVFQVIPTVIGGQPKTFCDTITSFIDVPLKGGGSAYGGKWKPAKPEDQRLIGKPGEIKITFKADGTKIETKIGPGGLAERERHHTSAPNPKYHTNPHDHIINWHTPREGKPNFGKPIDYWDGNPPEFKMMQWGNFMKSIIYGTSTPEDNRFHTISEFKECIICGGEVIFSWAQRQYGVFRDSSRYCIALADGEREKWCDTPDEVLEYIVGEDRLRDVITQVIVLDRTI